MPKYTEEDLDALVEVIRNKRGKGIAFLIGAGCSKSAGIPLASELVEEIHQEYPKVLQREIKDPKQKRNYGACMGVLSEDERKALISRHLDAARVNWGHIALACLIHAKHVRRVLTLNFDSLLARACGLLGQYPATYDFGIAPAENIHFLSEPCIIHLHGQGTGPVLMNTDSETEIHATKLGPLFKDTLDHNNLIVIGYSGEADKIFPLIEQYYTDRSRIYWLGYSEEPPAHLIPLIGKRYVKYYGGTDADLILIALAQNLECFPPKIITDPAAHLLDEIDPICNFPSESNAVFDILSNLKGRLKSKGKLLILSALDQLIFQRNYDAIISNNDAGDYHKSWALVSKGALLARRGDISGAIELFDLTIKRYSSNDGGNLSSILVTAYYNKALILAKNERVEDSIVVFNELIEKYKNRDDRKIVDVVGTALRNRVTALIHISKGNLSEKVAEDIRSDVDKCEAIKGTPEYNRACLEALLGNEAKCREALLNCKAAGTLPNVAHLTTDPDLDRIRSADWFKSFLADLDKPEI